MINPRRDINAGSSTPEACLIVERASNSDATKDIRLFDAHTCYGS
jgi:hypothetical protein